MLPLRPRCSSKYQVRLNLNDYGQPCQKPRQLISPSHYRRRRRDLQPSYISKTDTEIINIRQLLLPILMKIKYDEMTLTHNLSGVILPTERYEHI